MLCKILPWVLIDYFYHGQELGQADQVVRKIHSIHPNLSFFMVLSFQKNYTRKPVEPEMDNKMDIIIFSAGVFGTKISL